jgi:hypothetical protein
MPADPIIPSTTAIVTRRGALDMQVCVPGDWSDAQVIAFAERANPCGTTNGWSIRREGDEALRGMPERNPCVGGPAGNVHIMLDA